jgi:hypothetical protein
VTDEGWRRLGSRILSERSRRWRTRDEFATATGLSARLLDDLETGRRDNYQDETLSAVEVALGWMPGTSRRIVQGGRVRREMDPDLVRVFDVWPRLSPDAKRMLAELAERVADPHQRG